jgi:hypothetical protein
MNKFFDDNNFVGELEKVCQAWEKAADSKYITEYYDIKMKFVNQCQSENAKTYLQGKSDQRKEDEVDESYNKHNP